MAISRRAVWTIARAVIALLCATRPDLLIDSIRAAIPEHGLVYALVVIVPFLLGIYLGVTVMGDPRIAVRLTGIFAGGVCMIWICLAVLYFTVGFELP